MARVLTDQPDMVIGIEAGACCSNPGCRTQIGPLTRPDRMVAFTPSPRQRAANGLLATDFVAVILGGAFFALRNLCMGRGDRGGAMRPATLAFALMMAAWVVFEHDVPMAAGQA